MKLKLKQASLGFNLINILYRNLQYFLLDFDANELIIIMTIGWGMKKRRMGDMPDNLWRLFQVEADMQNKSFWKRT